MPKSNILIFVDADHKIGLGHISRQLSLVSIWKNFNVYFFTSTVHVKNIIPKKYPITFYNPSNLNFLKNKILKLSPKIILVDKLNERSSIIKLLQNCCDNVISIDYIGKNKKLLNHGISILYPKNAVSTYPMKSLFDYAILKNSFLKYKPITVKKYVKNILLLQGGADTHCFIPKILTALQDADPKAKITVVLGSEFKCWNKLNPILSKNPQITIKHNVKNMAKLMKNFDLAITAAGNTLLEVTYLGIPCVIICSEKFENETATLVENLGFGINLGFGKNLTTKKISITVKTLIDDYDLRKNMNKNSKKIIDGNGSKRIYNVVLNEDIK